MTSPEMAGSYEAWKGWDPSQFGRPSPGAEFLLDRLVRRYGLDTRSVCEVGFGNGEMLGVLTRRAVRVVGIEQRPALVEAARKRFAIAAEGADAWQGQGHDGAFDLVIGLDVLEHMDFEELRQFVRWLARSLKPGGQAVFRFPEGASPLSAGNLNGDFSHRTALTREKVRYLLDGSGLAIVAYDPEPVFSNRLSASAAGRVGLRILDVLRRGYGELLRWLVLPISQNVLFRENTVLVLRRSAH